MRFVARVVVVASLVFLPSCGQIDRMKEKLNQSEVQDKARQRVTGVLDGIRKGGADTTIDVQRAICLWYNGSLMLDMATLSRASDLYQSWQNEGHVARHISSFEVLDAAELGDGAVAVSGTIERKPFTIRVTPGAPLAWIKPPQE